MNELQEKYGEKYGEQQVDGKKHCRLQIIGFPCNQFGYQEPSENFELMNTLKYVRPGYGYEPKFPLSGKLEVNGKSESPVFTYLKSRCPAPMGLIANRSDITWTPIRNNDISWNFQKWLIQSNGHPYKRYTSRTKPEAVEGDIVSLLQQCVNGENSQTQNSGDQRYSSLQNVNSGTTTTHIVGSNTLLLSSTDPLQPSAAKQKRSPKRYPHDGLFY